MLRGTRQMTHPMPLSPADQVQAQDLDEPRAGDSVPREAVLIVNVASRRGRALFDRVRQQLTDAGIALVSAEAIEKPAQMRPAVRAAIASGVPMVILGGGDGTISSLIGEFAGRPCVFAPLPLGTANSFARSIGLGPDPLRAIEGIVDGHIRVVDLGMIDGVYFANSAAIGLSPMIGATIPHGLKAVLGRLAYPLWAIRCLFAFRPFRLILRDETAERRLWASEVRILNGGYHAGVRLSEEAEVDSGEIVVQVVTGRSLLRLLWDWYARILGLRRHDPHVMTFRGQDIRIETRPRRRISVDGEPRTHTPVRLGIASACVLIVAPDAAD